MFLVDGYELRGWRVVGDDVNLATESRPGDVDVVLL